MRSRALPVLVVLGAIVLVAVLLAWPRGGDGDRKGDRVDVVFDSARGVSPGSAVKIAGAKVGSVDAVTLTPENRARVTLRLNDDIGPLHRDATCGIRPEGLIGESFVTCAPGKRSAGALRTGEAGRPTIPVGSTSHPVNIADLLNLWSLPTGERARILVTELGLGMAGNGDELRRIVERAHPTLRETRKLLAVVDGQRDRLRSAVERTGRVAATVAGRRRDLGRLIDDGSKLASRGGATTTTCGPACARSRRCSGTPARRSSSSTRSASRPRRSSPRPSAPPRA